ncbi:MAG TPA: hypothetical protein VMH91_00365 [Candidatus Paceibacterota bacterium]|nr:hypothetical protein [Candidatus Paceibacterota bacterium]
MSWASRRRLLYLTGVILFLIIIIGGPIAYHFLTIQPTCHDGVQNQGETAPDRGGPCLLLNAAQLQPAGVLWARALKVRDGLYDGIAYVDNPNQTAGVLQASYEVDVYDSQNALVADKTGTTFVMPGGVTPVFVGGIDTGNRDAVHALFKFTSPLVWERVLGVEQNISVHNQEVSTAASSSGITAIATNGSVSDILNPTFVATVFDPTGNAIATSQTAIPRLDAGASAQIFFTWPSAFSAPVGSVDIIPVVAPQADPTAQE